MKKLYLIVPTLLIAAGCTTANVATNTAPQETLEQVNATVEAVNESTNQKQEVIDEVTNEVEEVNPYEGWQTYTNEEYGYSVKYPGDWIAFNMIDESQTNILQLDKSNQTSIRFTSNENSKAATSFNDISIVVKSGLQEADSELSKVIQHNGNTYIFSKNAWFTEDITKIMDMMFKSIQFNS